MSARRRLERQRADLIVRYADARRRHDRTRATGASLLKATSALLQAELRGSRAARPAAAKAAPTAPRLDLFQEARA